nr:reverse transcriptase domain-containing protein [Streptomyces tailanensis]
MEPVFEAQFTEASYGFRPKRSAIDACEAVRAAANQRREWVFEADIRNCFGMIDHDALMAQVPRHVVDRPMLKLIRTWLRRGVPEGGVPSPTGAGTPQGSPISPLPANIALHVLDEAWQDEGRRLGVLVRYCDDFVVLSPTRQRAEQAQQLMRHAAEVHHTGMAASDSQAHMAGSEILVGLADELLAVWDGKPAWGYGGTADVVSYAQRNGVPVRVLWPEGATRE